MSNPHWVTAHGRQILVETLETPRAKAGKIRKHQEFVNVPLQWAAETAKVTGTPGAMVWILLRYMAWKTKSTTFSLSNTLLARYGVNRKTKYRVLANLENAGRIKTQRRNKRSLLVTPLDVPR